MSKSRFNMNYMSQFRMFTINNPRNYDFTEIPHKFMIWQIEVGEEEDTEHIQGYVIFPHRFRLYKVIKLFKKVAHIEPRFGSHLEAIEYCSKDDTRIDDNKSGPYITGSDEEIAKKPKERTDLLEVQKLIKEGKNLLELYENVFPQMIKYGKSIEKYKQLVEEDKMKDKIKEQFNSITLKGWQNKVLNKLLEQDDRQILWVYDEKGNIGKTFLAKYIIAKYKDVYYTRGGKNQDVFFAYNGENIVIYDIPRESEQYLQYNQLEQFKDGLITSSKYESRTRFSIGIKIVCFSNFKPDTTKLSEDRWKIMEIS